MISRRVAVAAITVATVTTLMGATLWTADPAHASSPTALTAGTVTPSPALAGANSSYTLTLTTASPLPAGGTITLVAPSGTDFSPCSSGCSGLYSIAVDHSHSATVQSAVSSTNGGNTANQVQLSLATSTIASGDTVTITTHQTTNPQKASATYTMAESTSTDTAPATSPAYAITAAAPQSITPVSGGGQSAKVGTAYAQNLVASVADTYGNPVGGADVTFTAPASGASGSFDSSGCPGNTASTPTQCTVTTAADGTAQASTFTANSTAGSYDVTASVVTGTGTASASYHLDNTSAPPQSVTPGTVTVSDPTEGVDTATYTVTFTTAAAISRGQVIELTGPNGTAFPNCPTDPAGCGNPTVTYGPSGSPTSAPVVWAGAAPAVGPGSTATSATDNQISMTVQDTATDPTFTEIPADTPVTVKITGVTNPTQASRSYVIAEADQADQDAVDTASYPISPSAATTLAIVSGSGQSATVGRPYSAPLVVVAADKDGNQEWRGTPVTFVLTDPSGHPGGTFPGGSVQQTDETDASGQATSSTVTANLVAGAWNATASLDGGVSPVQFGLTNTPGAPARVTATGGTPQSATLGTAFAVPFQATVDDQYGNRVPGAEVTFEAPTAAGAPSGSFAGGHPAETVASDASGVATSSTFTANGVVGSYTVTASTPGASSATYSLTNQQGSPAGLSVAGGAGQTAHLGTLYAKALSVKVTDAHGYPVAGQSVTFSAPALSGPSGVFVLDKAPFLVLSTTVKTGSDGVATAPPLVSWLLPGQFRVTASTVIGSATRSVQMVLGSTDGYWLAGADGSVQPFGDAQYLGSAAGIHLSRPVVGMAAMPDGRGYWLVASDGGIFRFGSARFLGSTGSMHLNQPIVGMAATPDGGGYWLVAADGGIFAFGDAGFYGSTGSMHLNQPIVGMAATSDGGGYWLVAADGGMFAFGDAGFYGSMGDKHLNQPIVGMTPALSGRGYWLVASDGGIFSFGDADFYGSTGAMHLNQPIVGMTATPSSLGYWFVARDGGVFAFGPEARFYGSGSGAGETVVGMAEG